MLWFECRAWKSGGQHKPGSLPDMSDFLRARAVTTFTTQIHFAVPKK
jgi:hypothetical protein